MSLPYVLRILVTSGEPDGVRVVEKSNWTGQGVVFARSDLALAIAQGIGSPGIYVLVGDDPDGGLDRQVYIGQGEDIGRRLKQHQKDDGKEFWNTTVVFLSKDGTLNRAHVMHLESRLVALAHDAKRVKVSNGTRPPLPILSPADLAEAEGFLVEMLAIFPVLGVDAFEKPVVHEAGRIRYSLTAQDASGQAEERSDGFLVLRGATARVQETAALGASTSRLRARLIENGLLALDGTVYRLTDDHLFGSPSTAAAVLLGSNVNGREAWKDAAGTTLKDHQIAAAEFSSPPRPPA